MAAREFLYTDRGEPKVVFPAVIVLVITIVVGALGLRVFRREQGDAERAAYLSRSGRFDAAEALYLKALRDKPTVPVALAFIENNRRASRTGSSEVDPARPEKQAAHVMRDAEVGAFLSSALPPDVSLVARFAYESMKGDVSPEVRGAVTIGSMRDPPTAWHSHMLGVEAAKEGRALDAADAYVREGLAFPERTGDIDLALGILIEANAWDEVRTRMQDARVRDAADAATKYHIASHEGDWLGAVKWALLGPRSHVDLSSLIMTGVAALAWAFFCSRLGKLGERPLFRGPLYLTAFVLGVFSVVPTMFLIVVEETKLHIVESGDPLRDALFFVFGVGLREEASKLLLFLPLYPLLRKWGDKLDVLVCGAMVGLGFAAEENLGYLASGDLHTGLARFVTANFFHMALTGIVAHALDDFLRDTERNAASFMRATLMVVGLHGAYDFLLSHEELGGSYMAMMVFIFLTRLFLVAVDDARRKRGRGLSLVHSFVFATAVVTGVTAVRAYAMVGASSAAFVMSEGLLGVAIILIVFVRTLSEM